GWGAASPPSETLARVAPPPRLVEDFRPIHECLDWRLSDAYWRSVGVAPFAQNTVPFVINNSGRLSQAAAAVFFAHCRETGATGPLRILELGAGAGLFARYFLDAFRALCEHEKADFYE